MKPLSILLLCLVGGVGCSPQVGAALSKDDFKERPTDTVFYSVTENTVGYHQLADTAQSPPMVPSVQLSKGEKVLVVSRVGRKWVRFSTQGVRYYTRARFLKLADAAPQPAPTQYGSGAATGGGHTIQTGPRGGRYYINSNGNKTYIKRK